MSDGAREFVDVDGVRIGCTTEGSGPPLLVVGSSLYYPRTFSTGLRERRRLVCMDLPHFVPLDAEFSPDWISFDFYIDCIDAVSDALQLDTFTVAGHSHHGNVALEYARRRPERVTDVVLIGSPPVDVARTRNAAQHYWEAHASPQRKDLLLERRASLTEVEMHSLPQHEAFVARYVLDAPLYWHRADYDAAWLWEGMRFNMDAVSIFQDFFVDYDLRETMRDVHAPLLVVMGRDDFAVPHTLWNMVLPELHDGSFHLLGGSGHTPQLERPAEFDRLLLDRPHV